ncbi:LysR family transcriptional regulator [Burkholderia pseudomallei]|nr:LysR family transcriptional regulator [Burkholderia pseudomallei]MPT71041.1 LysR family transcriptional regulator [Burkholderia pseudomallei]MPT80108.1 LysR family transcriptional regulator [Burkholderia pseudomallei]MPT85402.1 LysR family transcriptional regulator [Burkholderia pseudomallei]MPT91968.1 LysR family transcriptional regulator [Burkholderia pseudomallei]
MASARHCRPRTARPWPPASKRSRRRDAPGAPSSTRVSMRVEHRTRRRTPGSGAQSRRTQTLAPARASLAARRVERPRVRLAPPQASRNIHVDRSVFRTRGHAPTDSHSTPSGPGLR